MAEQRRQAGREGRRSREVHSHKHAETHAGGHTHMLMRVYANKHADEPSQRTHTLYTGLIVFVHKTHIGVYT